ncbi:MAG: hypothetical protein Q7U68_04030, partial [Candidatus Roizmanbacteria bacterium]|nr:hypothetical protein [Candidatus Roizmanbacteria bacterium]
MKKIIYFFVMGFPLLCSVAFAGEDITLKVKPMLDKTLRSFSSGNIEEVASLFRYFEESVDAAEVAKEKKIVRLFFALVKEKFGQPVGFETATATSIKHVNIEMESANSDLWNN